MKLSGISLFMGVYALSFAATACGATGEVNADFTQPTPGGGEIQVGFRVGLNGEKEMTASGAPICMETCFSGADGGDLGCVTVELPASAQVPEGAVRWSATQVDCPTGTPTPGGAFSREARRHPDQRYWLFGAPIIPFADDLNVSYSFYVDAASQAHAQARRDAVLAGGIGTPVGPGFEVLMYTESAGEYDNFGAPIGVRLRQAGIDPFTSWSMDLNGVSGYATLGGSGVLHYGAGEWDVVETFIPVSDFQTSVPYDNESDLTWTVSASTRVWSGGASVWSQ